MYVYTVDVSAKQTQTQSSVLAVADVCRSSRQAESRNVYGYVYNVDVSARQQVWLRMWQLV